MKYIYLLLATLGICWTWYYNVQFFMTDSNSSLSEFIAQCTSNLPSKSISADATTVALTFFAWYIPESLRLKIKYWWIFIPLTLGIAIAFTFPLFLYIRANRLEALQLEN